MPIEDIALDALRDKLHRQVRRLYLAKQIIAMLVLGLSLMILGALYG